MRPLATLAALAALFAAPFASAEVRLGIEQGAPPRVPAKVDYGGEVFCTFAQSFPLEGIPGNGRYGVFFQPNLPDGAPVDGQQSGPVQLHTCSNFPVRLGPNFGSHFLAWNSAARNRGGSVPRLPGIFDLFHGAGLKAGFHVYVAGPLNFQLQLRALRGGEEIARGNIVKLRPRVLQKLTIIGPSGTNEIGQVILTAPQGSPLPPWAVADGLTIFDDCELPGGSCN